MAWLTDATLNKMADLGAVDMRYCVKLAGRLQKLGVSSKVASAGLASMIDEEAIPNGCATMPSPTLFKKHLPVKETEAIPQMMPALS